MAMRSRDLTLDLDEKRISILTWSSDPLTYTVSNKLIRTTLDNTIQDLKEVICERSHGEGSRLNPLALKLYYRHGELRNSDPLSTVFQLEIDSVKASMEPVRIRVEFDKSKLSAKEVQPCLLNVNLITSSGRVLRLSESMHTTVESLKYTLVDDLHLDNGMSDITGLEFNGGIDIGMDNDSTIGDLLELDTVPFGDLNLFVTLASDTRIRLSSPLESILRTQYMSVNLDTTIFTVKKYILDQYSGQNPNVTTTDIKIIYFGRVLTDDTRIRNITSPSQVNSPLILHFSLQEPDANGSVSGFWSDLRNGKLFEFYPKEPNPHFATESQRIERLRRQFRNIGQAEEPTTVDRSTSVFVQNYNLDSDRFPAPQQQDQQTQPIQQEQEHHPVEEDVAGTDIQPEQGPAPRLAPTPTINDTQQLPHVGPPPARLIPPMVPTQQPDANWTPEPNLRPNIEEGERRILEDFLRTNRLPEGSHKTGTTYDVIEKDGQEYLVDQLETHEVVYKITVQSTEGPREIVLSSSQVMINDRIPGKPYLMINYAGYAKLQRLGVEIAPPECQRAQPTRREERIPLAGEELPHVNVDAPIADGLPAPVEGEVFRMELRVDLARLGIEGLVLFLSHSIKYFFVYTLFVQSVVDEKYHTIAIVLLVGWALLTFFVQDIRGLFSRALSSILQMTFGIGGDHLEGGARGVIKSILAFGTRTGGLGPAQRALRGSIVDFVLFFTSLSPTLHNMFVGLLRELLEERRSERDSLLARLDELNAGVVAEEAEEAEEAEHADIAEQMPVIDGNATGVNVHDD